MGRFAVISLTERAATRVREIVDSRESARGIRLGIKKGGCAGMEYTMAYVADAAPTDERVDDNGVSIVIDAKAVLFLLGSVIDYEVTPLHSKFTFRNPNQTDACGCGESVTIVPAAAE